MRLSLSASRSFARLSARQNLAESRKKTASEADTNAIERKAWWEVDPWLLAEYMDHSWGKHFFAWLQTDKGKRWLDSGPSGMFLEALNARYDIEELGALPVPQGVGYDVDSAGAHLRIDSTEETAPNDPLSAFAHDAPIRLGRLPFSGRVDGAQVDVERNLERRRKPGDKAWTLRVNGFVVGSVGSVREAEELLRQVLRTPSRTAGVRDFLKGKLKEKLQEAKQVAKDTAKDTAQELLKRHRIKMVERNRGDLPVDVADKVSGDPLHEYGNFVEVAGSGAWRGLAKLPPVEDGALAIASGRSGNVKRHPLPQDPKDPDAVFFSNGTQAIVKSVGEDSVIIEVPPPHPNAGLWHMHKADLLQRKLPHERKDPRRARKARKKAVKTRVTLGKRTSRDKNARRRASPSLRVSMRARRIVAARPTKDETTAILTHLAQVPNRFVQFSSGPLFSGTGDVPTQSALPWHDRVPPPAFNPKYRYRNPAGLYGYPLNEDFIADYASGELPFAADRRYMHIFEMQDAKIVGEQESKAWYSQENLHADLAKLRDAYPALAQVIEKGASESAFQWPFGRLWGATRALANTIAQERRRERYRKETGEAPTYVDWDDVRPAFAWNGIMRFLGHDNLIDLGDSLLHSAEPTQTLAMHPKKVKHIETLVNPDFAESQHQQREWDKSVKRLRLPEAIKTVDKVLTQRADPLSALDAARRIEEVMETNTLTDGIIDAIYEMRDKISVKLIDIVKNGTVEEATKFSKLWAILRSREIQFNSMRAPAADARALNNWLDQSVYPVGAGERVRALYSSFPDVKIGGLAQHVRRLLDGNNLTRGDLPSLLPSSEGRASLAEQEIPSSSWLEAAIREMTPKTLAAYLIGYGAASSEAASSEELDSIRKSQRGQEIVKLAVRMLVEDEAKGGRMSGRIWMSWSKDLRDEVVALHKRMSRFGGPIKLELYSSYSPVGATNANFDGTDISLRGSQVEGASFVGAKISLRSATLRSCDLTNSEIVHAHRSIVENSKWSGVRMRGVVERSSAVNPAPESVIPMLERAGWEIVTKKTHAI